MPNKKKKPVLVVQGVTDEMTRKYGRKPKSKWAWPSSSEDSSSSDSDDDRPVPHITYKKPLPVGIDAGTSSKITPPKSASVGTTSTPVGTDHGTSMTPRNSTPVGTDVGTSMTPRKSVSVGTDVGTSMTPRNSTPVGTDHGTSIPPPHKVETPSPRRPLVKVRIKTVNNCGDEGSNGKSGASSAAGLAGSVLKGAARGALGVAGGVMDFVVGEAKDVILHYVRIVYRVGGGAMVIYFLSKTGLLGFIFSTVKGLAWSATKQVIGLVVEEVKKHVSNPLSMFTKGSSAYSSSGMFDNDNSVVDTLNKPQVASDDILRLNDFFVARSNVQVGNAEAAARASLGASPEELHNTTTYVAPKTVVDAIEEKRVFAETHLFPTQGPSSPGTVSPSDAKTRLADLYERLVGDRTLTSVEEVLGANLALISINVMDKFDVKPASCPSLDLMKIADTVAKQELTPLTMATRLGRLDSVASDSGFRDIEELGVHVKEFIDAIGGPSYVLHEIDTSQGDVLQRSGVLNRSPIDMSWDQIELMKCMSLYGPYITLAMTVSLASRLMAVDDVEWKRIKDQIGALASQRVIRLEDINAALEEVGNLISDLPDMKELVAKIPADESQQEISLEDALRRLASAEQVEDGSKMAYVPSLNILGNLQRLAPMALPLLLSLASNQANALAIDPTIMVSQSPKVAILAFVMTMAKDVFWRQPAAFGGGEGPPFPLDPITNVTNSTNPTPVVPSNSTTSTTTIKMPTNIWQLLGLGVGATLIGGGAYLLKNRMQEDQKSRGPRDALSAVVDDATTKDSDSDSDSDDDKNVSSRSSYKLISGNGGTCNGPGCNQNVYVDVKVKP